MPTYLCRRANPKHALRFIECDQEILTDLITVQHLPRPVITDSIFQGRQLVTVEQDISLIVIEYQKASVIRQKVHVPGNTDNP